MQWGVFLGPTLRIQTIKLAVNPIIVQLERIMHAWQEPKDDVDKHRLDQKSIR